MGAERAVRRLGGRGDRRVGERERRRSAKRLARAATRGRFAGSDLYELEILRVASALTARDLQEVEARVRGLVPSRVRRRLLRSIARGHAEGKLDFEEFLERTDRALLPLSSDEAALLVSDLRGRVRALGALLVRGRHHRAARSAIAGGAVAAVAVTIPVAAVFPGELWSWLPVVALTGAFAALGAAAVALILPRRRWPARRLPVVGGASGPGGRPEAMGQPGAMPRE